MKLSLLLAALALVAASGADGGGAAKTIARAKGLVQADLGPQGLFYAYNVPGGGTKPGRVAFVPASALPK